MDFVGSLINGAMNLGSTIATNNSNERIAQENLAFQKENLEYQKDLQQQIFAREDTAYQRKVNDLIAAGINPAVAATGSGSAAGSVVNTQAPHNDIRYQAPQFNLGSVLDTLSSIEKLKGIKVETDNAKKQGDYIDALKNKVDAETTKIAFDNDFLSKTQEDRVKSFSADYWTKHYQLGVLKNQAELNQIGYDFSRYGILPKTGADSPFMRELQLKNKLLDLQWNTANQNFKKIKNENDAFWWRFGIDNFNKLASGLAEMFKVGSLGGFF